MIHLLTLNNDKLFITSRENHLIDNGTVDFLDAHTLFSWRVKEDYDISTKSLTPLLKFNI